MDACKSLSSQELIKLSEKKAVQMADKRVEPLNGLIENIYSFQRHVPIIDKERIFSGKKDVAQTIFKSPTSTDIQNILLSSGTSGQFSFGVSSQKEANESAQFIDVLFHYFFDILNRKTLLINCLAQAVKLPASSTITVEVGPRSDSLIYILTHLAKEFDQLIIVGDNYFLKSALEEAADNGVDLKKLNIHLVLGGVFLPENVRAHLLRVLQKEEKNTTTKILSSMGISEFGLNLFFESDETIALRQLAIHDPLFRSSLIDQDAPGFTPLFFNYFPQIYYLEELNHDLIITSLKKSNKLPLIRYNTKDKGKIIAYNLLEQILKEFNIKENILPPFKSPLVMIYGKCQSVAFNGTAVYPEQILEALFKDYTSALKITGLFKMDPKNNGLVIHIQLKPGQKPTKILNNVLDQLISEELSFEVPLQLHTFEEFPYGRDIDYQRKFQYL